MRRASAPAALAVLLIVAAVDWSGSGADFAGSSVNASNTLTAATLAAFSSLSAAPSGNDVSLSWPAGGSGVGYQVYGAANGSSSSCATSPTAALGGSSTPATAYTDAGRGAAAPGSWWCYRVQSVYHSWTSTSGDPVAATRTGVAVDSVTLTNAASTTGCPSGQGGTARTLDCGDRIVVDFDQPMKQSSGPASTDTVCGVSNELLLGDTAGASAKCATSDAVSVGTLSGVATTNAIRYAAAFSWNSTGDVLTILLGARDTNGQKNTTLGTGSWTFSPTTTSTALVSSGGGGVHVCDATTTGGVGCSPTASGSL